MKIIWSDNLFAGVYTIAIDGSGNVKDFEFPLALAPTWDKWLNPDPNRFEARYRVQFPHKQSHTIVSDFCSVNRDWVHYDLTQCRSFTPRECARIQTFPDNFFFHGSMQKQYEQVGNAVPVYLSRQIAGVLQNILEAI